MSVVLWLFSRLGDQLFMIFTACALAIENNVDYKIISYKFKAMDNNRVYWNSIFSPCVPNLYHDLKKDISMYDKNPVYIEESSDFKMIPYEPGTNNIIKGYFQSYKYFDKYCDKICDMFNINNKRMALKIKYSHLFTKKLVVIHIVSSEYVSIQDRYCIKKPQYYIHAISSLIRDIKDVKNYNFAVFYTSIDKDHVFKYMTVFKTIIKPSITFIDVPEGITEWEKMLLMSSGDHFILANSSISWFAAYLSETRDKIVYYPRKWFSNISTRHSSDMFPPSWKPIDF